MTAAPVPVETTAADTAELPPLVVLVPGGGWESADPAGLIPLVEALRASGVRAEAITYRAAGDDAYFPTPAEDIACAVAELAAAVPGAEVVLVGHSSGAHLAALVALRPDTFGSDCAAPMVAPMWFVGLAGPYDVGRAQGPAAPLFGAEPPDAAGWAEANPMEFVDRRPGLPVLLIHGAADATVPLFFTEQFAAALADAGHPVAEVYPDGVDHHAVYSAEVAAPIIIDWLGIAPGS